MPPSPDSNHYLRGSVNQPRPEVSSFSGTAEEDGQEEGRAPYQGVYGAVKAVQISSKLRGFEVARDREQGEEER